MKKHKDYDCNLGCMVENTLEIIRGKWKGIVLTLLFDKCYRFNELQRQMPGVTQRILTKQLRELEQAGLVVREVLSLKPFAVCYSLTDLGRTLKPVMHCLKQWSLDHGHEVYALETVQD
ncbi:MAG: helix-turn-helix transcriptional regulator [Reinekea forsetii]|jgi:DNA-binding HxlR family transcriptional regulator|uniref:Transcriptional regulator, HxlR family n=1 Tax=Reinekea forsetii TaxID=1336806 RepID=A0A2K8KU36_9GAMM|nr:MULTISPECIES: helix-turn-helix domain-containing protein [Reinekea]ATX77589.1 transcriptional regulator, HxlR family [Reinekea forsetii]MDB9894452.1 helix-turn-helix transcriptional regulator [Reinekea forsetii]MDO7641496.1 helix-turn-helix transcriptional regulator [Reinekea forsetii]MDO7643439.1 helix-turn-helix transcriptional regulator [Reinekea forsetii]MDO7674647.1 helix-turn-helix transcriptional regulator [Reinekea forsetii]